LIKFWPQSDEFVFTIEYAAQPAAVECDRAHLLFPGTTAHFDLEFNTRVQNPQLDFLCNPMVVPPNPNYWGSLEIVKTGNRAPEYHVQISGAMAADWKKGPIKVLLRAMTSGGPLRLAGVPRRF
jgi:hypothetical protein